MTNEHVRLAIIMVMLVAFIGLMAVVLLFVSVDTPEMGKIVGGLFGFFTGSITTMIAFYFRSNGQ